MSFSVASFVSWCRTVPLERLTPSFLPNLGSHSRFADAALLYPGDESIYTRLGCARDEWLTFPATLRVRWREAAAALDTTNV